MSVDKIIMSRVVVSVVIIVYLNVTSAVLHESERYSNNLENNVVSRNVTPECLSHTSYWMSQLRLGVPWALTMLDSTTKLTSGVLLGSDSHLGNFDQCISIYVQDEVAKFQGKYCRAWMDIDISEQILNTPKMMYAICVPSTCSPEEIQFLLQDYVAPALGIGMTVSNLNPNDCYIKEPPTSLHTDAVICVILACLLVSAVVISAVVEWRLADKTPPLVRACSLTSTCRSLFNTRKHHADISCLHGLRVGSMLWIILGHRYDQERWLPLSNPNMKETYFISPLKMTVGNAMPSVDTFFLLSGLLMCTSFFREIKRSPAFDVIKFYVYRYLRLVVPIGVVILLYITIMPLTGNGPLWNNYFELECTNCKVNWWTNLVFVNNYINKEGFRMCLGQTWYTAVDMQLAWLSPLVLLPLYHSPRAGLQLMTLLILISCFIPFTVTYIFKFPPTNMMAQLNIDLEGVPKGNFSLQIYNATQCRATPYLCGILFGYLIFKTQKQNLNLTKKFMYAGWACSTAIALAVIYTLSVFYQSDYVYSDVESSFYAGFHRLGWSISITWIIFACINKYGGMVDKILSWSLLLPFSRLTYSAFLLHMIPMTYDSATKRTQSRFTDYDAIHGYFGDVISVYVLSFFLYVLVEGPLLSALKIVFSKGGQASNKKSKQSEKSRIIENTK